MGDVTTRYPLAVLAVAVAIGIALGDRFPAVPAVALALSGCALPWAARAGRIAPAALLLLAILLGFTRQSLWESRLGDPSLLGHLPLTAASAAGTVRVAPEPGSPTAVVAVDRFRFDGLPDAAVRLRLRVVLPESIAARLAPGDRLRIDSLLLEPLSPQRNPGGFDARAHWRRAGVRVSSRIRDPSTVTILPAAGFSVDRPAHHLRARLAALLDRSLSERARPFMNALLLGLRRGIPETLRDAYRDAGVIHVLAISGLHVGFLVMGLQVLGTFLPLGFRWRNLLVLAVLLVYLAITGSPSVGRATTMAAFLLAGGSLERPGSALNALGGAALVLLGLDPQQLFQPGFQLSFAAVAAILFCYDRLQPVVNWLSARIDREPVRESVRRLFLTPLQVSLSAQLGTFPLLAAQFDQISLIGIWLNLAVIPLTGVLVGSGFLLLASAGMGIPAAGPLASLIDRLLAGQNALVHHAAELPGAVLPVGGTPWTVAALATLGLLPLVWRTAIWRHLALGALTFALLMTWAQMGRGNRHFEAFFLDVGQGDAALVRPPSGAAALIDTGPVSESGHTPVIAALRHLGVNRLRALVISHDHADHVAAALPLLEAIAVDSVYLAGIPDRSHWRDRLLTVLRRREIPWRGLWAGDRVFLDEHTRMLVLGPDSPGQEADRSLNDASLIVQVHYREWRLLFPGDAEALAESELTAWGDLLRSDVLKVGHHGSSTSSGEAFLETVRPGVAVVSVGRFNRFGHPDPAVLERLDIMGAAIYRTDGEGCVRLRLREGRWERVF